MHFRADRMLMFVLLLAAALAGCRETGPAAPGEAARPATHHWEPTAAQPKLRTLPLRVGSHAVEAEIALEPKEQATGLMFRDSMEPDAGMLFVFLIARPVAFFMKNTHIPLTVAYIGPDGIIRELHDLVPHEERPVNSVSGEVRFVLEMNRGWFAAKGIGPGVRITAGGQGLDEVFPEGD
jgi:uncharacterized membrane protein (UPF0127 family)